MSLHNEVVDMFVDDLHERNLYVCARICVKPPEVSTEGSLALFAVIYACELQKLSFNS